MDRESGLVPRRRRHAGEIFADTSGLILPYVTLMLVVIVGLALLAVDGSRALGLSTSLQKGADAVAIAMAAELDGRPDAITRANRARDELVNNSQTFAEGPAEMLFTIRFLRELPPDDADAIPQSFDVAFDPGGTLEEQSVAARFVEVTVEPRTLNTVLPASFIGTFDNTLTTSAQAVAGFTQAVCRFTPMFMCNPYEGTGVDIFDVLEDEDMKRQQLKLRMVGPSSGYVPGNFGFLVDNEGQTGANALRRALATSNPSFCFAQTGVDTEPGQSTGPVRQGLNVRFDIYDGPMSGNQYRGNAEFRPAQNVRKGYHGNNCNTLNPGDWENDQVQKKPLDPCHETGTCTGAGGQYGDRIGDGNWPFELYWERVHGDTPIPNDWSDTNKPTRYQVYRHEVENDLMAPTGQPDTSVENAAPMCYNGPQVAETIDRRLLHVAVVNCAEHGPLQGRETNVPVLTFAEFFITQPLGAGAAGTIYVETVRMVEPGTASDIAQDIVQLYR